MRDPEEIKKALKQCTEYRTIGDCNGCPYTDVRSCSDRLMMDALTLIEQLEAALAPAPAPAQDGLPKGWMTIDRLNEHRRLVLDLISAKENLEAAETRAGVCAQNLDGMPHGSGVSRKVEVSAEEIAARREDLLQCKAAVDASAPEIEAFIAEILDPKTKSAYRLRYIEGREWKEVADSFAYETAGGIKNRCWCYLASGRR